MAKARDPGLSGVELLDARPEVSRTAWDRSLLTSMVMLIWPSSLGGRAMVGLAARVGLKPSPRDEALDSCSFVVDWERSTCRKVDSPLSTDFSTRDIAGIPLHHNTQVTLCREGHMVGIPVELH